MSDNYDDFQHFGKLGDFEGFKNNRLYSSDANGNLKMLPLPITGDQPIFKNGEWQLESILNGFTVFPIWAEENGGIASGQSEWSYGNGATGAAIGIVLPFDCEVLAVTLNAETSGTDASIDIVINGIPQNTSSFTAANGFNNITAVPIVAGDRITFRTNTVNGTWSDVRVCAWLRIKSTAVFPTVNRSVVSNANVGFTSPTFAPIPLMTTTVTLSDIGTVDAIVNYSALRSAAANAVTQFRVSIQGNNGQAFFDTLSTFNDNGSAAHFVINLPAGTYVVTAEALTDNPITITSISLTASAVEN